MLGAGFMIIGFLLIGMAAGWIAWLIWGKRYDMSGAELFFIGLGGSLVGGGLTNVLMGYGLEFQITGLIGSAVGAIIVLPIYALIRNSLRGGSAE
jgi:uncharacterized membrane protein YeaQ/YmgE (transglycosylase-associated protein family)